MKLENVTVKEVVFPKDAGAVCAPFARAVLSFPAPSKKRKDSGPSRDGTVHVDGHWPTISKLFTYSGEVISVSDKTRGAAEEAFNELGEDMTIKYHCERHASHTMSLSSFVPQPVPLTDKTTIQLLRETLPTRLGTAAVGRAMSDIARIYHQNTKDWDMAVRHSDHFSTICESPVGRMFFFLDHYLYLFSYFGYANMAQIVLMDASSLLRFVQDLNTRPVDFCFANSIKDFYPRYWGVKNEPPKLRELTLCKYEQLNTDLGRVPPHEEKCAIQLYAGSSSIKYPWSFVSHCEQIGHTHITLEDIPHQRGVFSQNWDDDILPAVDFLENLGVVVCVYDPERQVTRLYLERIYRLEVSFARSLAEIIVRSKMPEFALDGERAASFDTTLDEKQRAAVHQGTAHPITIIDGMPGTGKTEVITRLIAQYEPHQILFVSFTGRACAQIRNRLARDPATFDFAGRVMTMHMVLTVIHYGGGQEAKNITDKVRCLVVDEASMTPLPLIAQVLEVMKGLTALRLAGDLEQLGPIGCGHPFLGITPAFPRTTLDVNHRFGQDEEGMVLHSNAVAIRNRTYHGYTSSTLDPSRPLAQQVSVVTHLHLPFHVKPDTHYAEYEAVIRTVCSAMLQGTESEERITQFICANRKVANVINRVCRRMFRKNWVSQEAKDHPRGFVQGDKILFTRNKKRGEVVSEPVSNGDIYYIRTIRDIAIPKNASPEVMLNASPSKFTTVRWSDDPLHEFEEGSCRQIVLENGMIVLPHLYGAHHLRLGYGVTVHKYQGSEMDNIVFVFNQPSPSFLPGSDKDRALIYTALTRAKNRVVTVWNPRWFLDAIKRNPFTIHQTIAENLQLELKKPEGVIQTRILENLAKVQIEERNQNTLERQPSK